VEAQLKAAVRLLDKAAQKGVLPKKTAARRVSRLTKAVQAAAKTSK
jgi:ribosomal protein S20